MQTKKSLRHATLRLPDAIEKSKLKICSYALMRKIYTKKREEKLIFLRQLLLDQASIAFMNFNLKSNYYRAHRCIEDFLHIATCLLSGAPIKFQVLFRLILA